MRFQTVYVCVEYVRFIFMPIFVSLVIDCVVEHKPQFAANDQQTENINKKNNKKQEKVEAFK